MIFYEAERMLFTSSRGVVFNLRRVNQMLKVSASQLAEIFALLRCGMAVRTGSQQADVTVLDFLRKQIANHNSPTERVSTYRSLS